MGRLDEAERALRLADIAFSTRDLDAAVAHLAAAIREFTAAGAPCRAALACVRLGDTFANAMGNGTAARAWFTRARRLVENEPTCIEQGWVAVAAMGCDVDDPAELLANAELALERARQFGDVNLETKALADAGLAHVQAGRVADGMALLDEAMALACGPADDTDTAGKAVCSFFTACYHTTDFERAASWTDLLRQHGLIASDAPAPVFLSSHCDSVQATSLIELGRWTEAERILLRAKELFESAIPGPSWHPDIALADLRVRQGRLAEAEALLVGKDHALEALLPAARLHLALGDHELARASARRGLRAMGDDRLRSVELLAVLAEAELALGEIDAAHATTARLVERADALGIAALQARAATTRARLLASTGDVSDAIDTLETVLDRVDSDRVPYRHALLLLELARLRVRAGDRAGAVLDARAADAALATLDVGLASDDSTLLDELCARQPVQPSTRDAVLAREGKWWLASFGGTSVRLPDTKGLRYLAELVAHPGAERHALALVDQVEGVEPARGIDRRRIGDAGPLLDARARTAYRHRIEALRSEIGDALDAGMHESAEQLQDELDQLVAQLTSAFGLGGRDRRAASASERARLNVTRALRAATGKLDDALPGAGEWLDRRLRTGLYCAYQPVDGDEVRWIVRSRVNENVTH